MSNARQTKPGPKTVLGTNPDGDMVWLSIQSPFGYIKISENQYWEVLKLQLSKVKFTSTDARGITQELEDAAVKALKVIAQIISDHAPVDSGQLSKSFKVVLPGDSLLDDDRSDRLLTIGGGEE